MRWLAKGYHEQRVEEQRRKRTIVRFALFPILTDEDDETPQWVWLEFYHEQQELRVVNDGYGSRLSWCKVARFASDPLLDELAGARNEEEE